MKEKERERTRKKESVKETQKMKGISIKVKLLGIILPVVILIMTLLVGVSYYISRSIIRNYSRNLLSSSISSQASQIKGWLNENLSAFQMVKQMIEQTSPDEEQLQGILDAYCGYHNNYPQGLYIADENGTLITAAGAGKTEADPVQSVLYKEGLTRWNMGFTSAYTNEAGEEVISASGILNDGSDTVKVISADLTLQRISIIVNSYIEMDQAQAFLVSADGTFIAHHDNTLISKKLSELNDPFMDHVAAKIEQQDFELAEIDQNMTAMAQIDGTDWILVSYIPIEIIFSDIDTVRTSMLVIGLISALILAVLVERVVHMVIRPVKKLTNVITSMTDGDFTVSMQTKSSDEIGIMSRHVEKFIVSMRAMIASIHEVSDKLNQQAGNSDVISGQMYDASRQQGISMRELNETVEQLSLSVNEIAENASELAMIVADTKKAGDQVNDRMQQTVEVSKHGKADMQHVGSAMDDINVSMGKLQQAIDKVGKASGEITKITGMIGDIADQTNLLSLNASIEAARAGEAGRGFAVVATEIGNLAQTSANSVHDIEKLVEEINSLVKDTITQTEESVENINDSSRLVEGALATFDKIFNNIDDVSGLVQEMLVKVGEVDNVATNAAAISQEQAASAQEILSASETMVTQVDSITGNSEGVSEGAKELKSSAEELYGQVARFKTKKEAGVQ